MPNVKTSHLGTYHLANDSRLYEPQRTNNFEFVIQDIDNLVNTKGERIVNASEVIRLSVVRSSVPHFSQGVIEIKRGNNTMKAAGVPTFDAGDLVVNDYIGADSKSCLMAWQELSYNTKTELVGRMPDYKKRCYLVEYSPDAEMVRQWRLEGCWVSSISEEAFDAESNNKKVITAKIEYDKAFMELPD